MGESTVLHHTEALFTFLCLYFTGDNGITCKKWAYFLSPKEQFDDAGSNCFLFSREWGNTKTQKMGAEGNGRLQEGLFVPFE